jgi:hypothetical protein
MIAVTHEVVIQHSSTQLFLAAHEQWVSEVEQAQTFLSTFDALNHCYAAKLRDSQVVIVFPNRKFDCVFKVNLP